MVSAAEECGSVLATHVSSVICRKVLLAVIKSSNTAESKIYMAIKMLTKVLESLSPEELIDILDEVAPPIVEVGFIIIFRACAATFRSLYCIISITSFLYFNFALTL